ncbi:MAG: AAA family ATPase [Limimaricola sp.]|nr:AAA family ATPase [Limimaricola sp.]
MRDDDDYLDEDRARAWVANLRGTPEPVAPSPWRSAADLAGVPVPDRRWLIEGLVPDRNVTLLTGDGGTGKSLLALQMAVAVATGAEWLGQPVRAGRAVVVSAEDDADEVHRRLHGIALGLGMGLGDMPRLVFRSLVGEGALLAEKGRTGFKPTALLAEIEAAAEGARLVVLDTLANFYPGDENDRAQTTHFVDLIKGVALRARCAVLLLAHPSKSAMDNGAGYSGNTAWNNAVRSRLYLKRITRQDGAEVIEPDPDARVLRTMKANYGRAAGEMSLSWCGGLFVPSAPETSLDRAAANAKADRVFLALLDAREASGRHVSHNPGPTYAPAVFARDDEAEGLTKRALAAAMERLFAAGRIVIKTHGSGAKARSHIGRGGENE